MILIESRQEFVEGSSLQIFVDPDKMFAKISVALRVPDDGRPILDSPVDMIHELRGIKSRPVVQKSGTRAFQENFFFYRSPELLVQQPKGHIRENYRSDMTFGIGIGLQTPNNKTEPTKIFARFDAEDVPILSFVFWLLRGQVVNCLEDHLVSADSTSGFRSLLNGG